MHNYPSLPWNAFRRKRRSHLSSAAGELHPVSLPTSAQQLQFLGCNCGSSSVNPRLPSTQPTTQPPPAAPLEVSLACASLDCSPAEVFTHNVRNCGTSVNKLNNFQEQQTPPQWGPHCLKNKVFWKNAILNWCSTMVLGAIYTYKWSNGWMDGCLVVGLCIDHLYSANTIELQSIAKITFDSWILTMRKFAKHSW